MISKILITPVGMECNLRCEYCYNGSHRNSVESPSMVIPDELLYKIFTEIYPFCKNEHSLDIIWHGGEPLLAGKGFYRRAVAIEKECLGDKIRLINGIQTNCTLVDNSWCDFFKEFDFFPSTSLDGPQFLHDQVRINSLGKGSYEKALRGYQLIKSRGIKCGLLMVITSANAAYYKELFQWILDTNIDSSDFLICVEPEKRHLNKPSLEISQKEAIRFMTNFFDIWFDHNDPNIKIRVFRDVLLSEMGGQPNVCSWKLGCLKHISFDENGNVFPCARFNVFPETSFGNIAENSLADIMDGDRTKKIYQEIAKGAEKCQSCEWQKACGSGCPFLKYAIHGKFNGQFVHCETRKALFRHIRERIWKNPEF